MPTDVLGELVSLRLAAMQPRSRAYYRVQATRGLTAGKPLDDAVPKPSDLSTATKKFGSLMHLDIETFAQVVLPPPLPSPKSPSLPALPALPARSSAVSPPDSPPHAHALAQGHTASSIASARGSLVNHRGSYVRLEEGTESGLASDRAIGTRAEKGVRAEKGEARTLEAMSPRSAKKARTPAVLEFTYAAPPLELDP